MPKPYRIPDEMLPEVMAKIAEGYTIAKVTEWLAQEKHLHLNESVVRRRISKVKKERQELTRAIMAEKISQTVLNDVEIINETILILRAEALKSLKDKKKPEARALFETMGRFVDRRLSLMGMNESQTITHTYDDSAAEELLERLATKIKPETVE